MLAASLHLSRGTPYIYMGEEIGMIDPDYDSMADYVDVESINAYQMLLDQGKSPEQALRLFKPNHVIILVRQCNGMLLKMQVFNRHTMVEGWEVL